MTDREKKAILEGLLFLWGDALAFSEMARVLEISAREVESLLEDLKEEMKERHSGLTLRLFPEAAQLAGRKDLGDFYSKLIKEEKKNKLSNSALETLAIIAYKGPITRIAIDQIRGVRSTGVMDTLLDRGLIEEAGRLEQIGRPILYRTSQEFLRAFDLQSLDDLPSKDQAQALLEREDQKEMSAPGSDGSEDADPKLGEEKHAD